MAAASLLLLAGSAQADTVALQGSPLTVHVGERGELQAFRQGQPSGIFFPASNPYGDAGFFLAFPDPNAAPASLENRVFGFPGSFVGPSTDPYTPISQGSASGSGTASDPLRQVTVYSTPGPVDVTQTTTYVNGTQEFRVQWDVLNETGGALTFRALVGADFFFDGSDEGTGIFTEGPPRFIGGTNADTGNSGGFLEVLGPPAGSPPWSAYQALPFGSGPNEIWGKVNGAAGVAAGSTVFDNTVVGQPVDNAGGVEWNASLANNGTARFALVVRSAVPTALQLSPSNAGSPQGVPITVTATALDSSGAPYAGRTLRWTITGANPGSGAAALAANGTAAIVDPGTNAGPDTIVAFVDFNGNGTREPAEPQASALATFVDNVAPDCTVRITGDRGAVGKPLVITVNCDSRARVSVDTVLTRPAARRGSASAAQRRRRRSRRVRIELPPKSATVQPGARTPIRIKVPKRIARRYAGRTLTARVRVTVTDTAGNRAVDRTKKKIKLAKLKKKRRRG